MTTQLMTWVPLRFECRPLRMFLGITTPTFAQAPSLALTFRVLLLGALKTLKRARIVPLGDCNSAVVSKEAKECLQPKLISIQRPGTPGSRLARRKRSKLRKSGRSGSICRTVASRENRALFDLAIDSKLRGCDLVKIRIGDVAAGSEIRKRTTVIQQKTGRPVQFEITETARESLTAWLDIRGGAIDDFLFPSRLARCPHLGTRQYARLVNEWVEAIGLPPEEYGTHSLRRTKASLIYKKTGNLRAVQILLGHTKIESTVRYLGVDVEDALSLAEGTDV